MKNEVNAISLAQFIVEKTRHSLFLTGKAGTGKSTFIRNIISSTEKKFVILAPTGIAAMNVAGLTIHSFFKFSFAPYMPGSKVSDADMPEGRKELIRRLDLVIIDEISMVRADLLDRIDAILRLVRGCDEPFGGVQMLMVGDPTQLAPIVGAECADVMKAYPSPHFFNSKVLKTSTYCRICLDQVYRQSDPEYIEILDRARMGTLSDEDIATLNRRFIPGFMASGEDRYITLVTHNDIADSINTLQMSLLPGESTIFNASVSGSFQEDEQPTHRELMLKPGARVIFIKNDPQKRYVNGSTGMVLSYDEEFVEVALDDGEIVQVEPVTWEKTDYRYNAAKDTIEAKVRGRFTQFPLKPAWALTVHKSQGMTFESIVVDIRYAFAAGQAYVALSRCRSLEGVVLLSEVKHSTFIVDKAAVEYLTSGISSLQTLADEVGYAPFEPKRKTVTIASDDASEDDPDPALVKLLKEWRLSMAREKNTPAYIILDNKTIDQIAIHKPLTGPQLLSIKGIGPHKTSQWGAAILEIVGEYLKNIRTARQSCDEAAGPDG